MDIDTNHNERIRQELIAAQMTNYGFLKSEIKKLADIIHETEHIGGVVYGRYEKGSGVLVATDRRVLFLDYKPMVKTADEITYDVVSGVSIGRQGVHAKVVLHTRLGDYALKFVNAKAASHFVKFIETKQIEHVEQTAIKLPLSNQDKPAKSFAFSQDAKIFLASHDIATFSSIDKEGNVHGATVYYAFDPEGHLYITTQIGTEKAHDVAEYPQVALTVTDLNTLKTLQISGLAQFETNKEVSQKVYKHILHPRLQGKDVALPPLLYMQKGEYIIIRITPTNYTYNSYK